ncbi:MAG: hypothetical protein AAGG08_08025 [Actinomycetota bacterium]
MTPGNWNPGKQGIAAAHRSAIADTPTHSVDVDSAHAVTHPNDSRWDYLCRRADDTYAAVEVHPAKPGEVVSMIAKRQWLVAIVASIPGPLATSGQAAISQPTAWHWVVPPNSPVTLKKTGKAYRDLVASGIRFPTRRILAGRL